jgi:hypothetical protein
LTLDNSEEIVAFCFGLGCHHGLALLELPFAGDLKFLTLTNMLFFFSYLLLSGLPLTFFESSLGPQSIDLSLTVSGFFLHSSKTSNFHFFFFLDALIFSGFGGFSCGFVGIVLNDFLFFINFFLASLLLFLEGDLVGSFDFSNHFQITNALLLGGFDLGKPHGLNLACHLFLFFGKKFTLTDTFLLAFLDLINNDKCAFSLLLLANNLALFGYFKTLQALDLHQQVKLFLFLNPLTLELLVFLKLFVSDGHNLGVQNHLVHVLYIVELLIQLSLSFA